MKIDIQCNTEDEVLFQNVAINSRRDLEWITETQEHDGHAVIVGGGPSMAEYVETIRWRQGLGQKVFALNGVAQFLKEHGITADYQVVLDARPQTVSLIGPAKEWLLASQVDPACFEKAINTKLWHPKIEGIEDHLPDRRESLTLIGGGTTVGLSAMCLAYTMGYRKLHLYGYDSSHRETGHAYSQPMNATEPVCKVTVFGKTFKASLAMAKQAEFFPTVCDNLIDLGCVITVEGDGLLPFMVRESASRQRMTEQEKYEAMWSLPEYRVTAPGEHVAQVFADVAQLVRGEGLGPESRVLDFGCGTGRGALQLKRLTGCDMLLIDFTANSRDLEAQGLPFMQADLSKPIDARGHYGFCTDVMEHIPPEQVEQTICNVMACAPRVFFQISLVPDNLGGLIGQPLHLSVHPFAWWAEVFARLGYRVIWSDDCGDSALYYVTTNHLEH